jgi:hypothetical protein
MANSYAPLIILATVLVVGCQPSNIALPETTAPDYAASIGTRFNRQECGTLRGTIRWDGPRPAIEPILRPLNNVEREAIANPNAIEIGKDNSIRNALVMLRGVDPAKSKPWPYEPAEVELHERGITVHQGHQRGRLGIVRLGDKVAFRTDGKATYGVRARGAAFFAQILTPKESRVERVFHNEGRVELASASGQFWASANLIVMAHPYAMLTDSAGRFQFDNVPAGRYELVIEHPNWTVVGNEIDPETGLLVRQSYGKPLETQVAVTIAAQATTETYCTMNAISH